MNTRQLKEYAPKARRDFIKAVMDRAAYFGLTKTTITPLIEKGDVVVIGDKAFPREMAANRQGLETRIQREGFDQVMESVAYTWFNRFVAIRFMEVHGYLNHGYRVLSHPEAQANGINRPEILDHATDVDLPGLDRDRVVELKLDGTRDEALYRMLLLAQCNALHQAMPFLFEKIGDETELLLPANLLHTDSLIRQMVDHIDESAWQEIEIIGWLYQFYISEKKDEVIGKVVKSEDIPAATQLFTPNWIVKYMVQNSLGAQWLATYPDSKLKDQMEYYIEPAEQTDEVMAQLAAITPDTLNPEALNLIDPACGSGHILVEAYELFKAIYLERGYQKRSVAQLILEKNLFGLDIDRRAAQLTGFALMMKGRADDRRLFERGVKLNVMALVDSVGFDAESLAPLLHHSSLPRHSHPPRHSSEGGNPESTVLKSDLDELKRLFEHATTFGSLIQVPEELAKKLPALRKLSEATGPDIFVAGALQRLRPLVQQAEMLAAQYDAVVANPPYMGGKYQTSVLKKYLKDHYQDNEKDFFSAFIVRGLGASKPSGRLGIVTPYVWMFLSSYETLRQKIITETTLTSLIQLEYNAFEPACIPVATFSLDRRYVTNFTGSYIKLSDFKGHINQPTKTLEAIKNPECDWFYKAKPDEFKKVPGSPMAYWISDRVREVFSSFGSLGQHGKACSGHQTGDNEQFLRQWFEVSIPTVGFHLINRRDALMSGRKWFPHKKGGPFRRWYGNCDYVMNWMKDGEAIRKHSSSALRNPDYMFRPGVTWSHTSSSSFSARLSMEGNTFNVEGPTYFSDNNLIALGFFCSQVALHLMQIMNPTLHFLVGSVSLLPYQPGILGAETKSTEAVLKKIVGTYREDWDAYERSWDFASLPLLSGQWLVPSDQSEKLATNHWTLATSYTAWITQNRETIAEMKRLEEENNRLFIDAYGLGEELTPDVPLSQITLTVNPAYRYGGKLSEAEQWNRFRQDTMKELGSYAIGCMMGRYSLDTPGLIYAHSGNDGFDPSRYTTFAADDDGIIPLTDTDWFDDDAANRLIKFISVAWDTAHLEENLTFLADNLSPRKDESSRDTLRRYLCDSFFKDHLKTYKKRPVYWLFASGKQKAFQCLVYLHRYNEGTLSRMRTEYVIPLQGKINARIDQLKADIDASNATSHQRKLEKERNTLVKQRTELQAFDENLRHYADKKISLDLDDGVKVNYGQFGDLLAEVKAVTGMKKKKGA